MSMKVGVIIPTRGDRSRFLNNCIAQMMEQTLQPAIIYTVDFAPAGPEKDITKRYRIGYDKLRGEGLDVIAFIEDDEAYSPDYLRQMTVEWDAAGRPDLFGTNYTHYFHLKHKAYFTMHHVDRSSMMNTFIKPDLSFPWCADEMPYTDIHLWDSLKKGKVLTSGLCSPSYAISVGIKHGVGLCGGEFHTNNEDVFMGSRGVQDPDFNLLKQVCSPGSFEFFKNYFA